jgi:hypothetical protein
MREPVVVSSGDSLAVDQNRQAGAALCLHYDNDVSLSSFTAHLYRQSLGCSGVDAPRPREANDRELGRRVVVRRTNHVDPQRRPLVAGDRLNDTTFRPRHDGSLLPERECNPG